MEKQNRGVVKKIEKNIKPINAVYKTETHNNCIAALLHSAKNQE